MKEFFEFRINYEFSDLLFDSREGKDSGEVSKSVKVVRLTPDDPRFLQIPIISNEVRQKYGKPFFFSWRVRRSYTKSELEAAPIFHLIVRIVLDPTGEENITLYDESTACEICGANAVQENVIKLNKVAPSWMDIARTVSGEVVVSERFVRESQKSSIKGASFEPVFGRGRNNKYFQLTARRELELSSLTVGGVDPFDFSEYSKPTDFEDRKLSLSKEVYKCPLGHTIGLNLLSEAHVIKSHSIDKFDFFMSKQKFGVRRGLLRPEPLYFCSPAFRNMVVEEKLRGFEFEIARLESS